VTTDNKPGKADDQDSPSEEPQQGPSEFKIGLVTFIIFLIFMTLWMYFRTAD